MSVVDGSMVEVVFEVVRHLCVVVVDLVPVECLADVWFPSESMAICSGMG